METIGYFQFIIVVIANPSTLFTGVFTLIGNMNSSIKLLLGNPMFLFYACQESKFNILRIFHNGGMKKEFLFLK